MRYSQLNAFHHVAINQGFSKAAAALGLTQPAISEQVRKLEIEYDVRLFNRVKRQTTLTAEGEKLLEITHRLFEVEQLARELLTESKNRQIGTLKIIADSARHMLHILGAFRVRYPGIKVLVTTGNSQEVLDELRSYRADIGVIGATPTTKDFETINLGSTKLVAFGASNQNYPTAITMQQLAASPLVLREAGSKTRSKFEQKAKAMGLKVTGQIVAEGRETVREIVAGGGGIAVVSEGEFTPDPRLTKIPIKDANITMNETLISLRERHDSKLIRTFMKMAAEVVGPAASKAGTGQS